MKIKSLLAGMVVSAALASCTNQDIIENESEINTSTAKAYIGIKIADPANGIARAATDGGFDHGTANENAIQKSLFLFYKDGVYAGKGSYEGELTVNQNQESGSIEATTTAVVVLQGKQEGSADYPNQVVAFLNVPDAVKNTLENKTLEEAMKIVKNITEISDYATDKKFIMTNSVYLKDGTIQVAAPVTSANFAQTATAATENPITIYVERVAAKVKMTANQAGITTPDIDITYNGESGVKLKLTIDGWGINGVNKNTYLLKNIDAAWNFNKWDWNDPDNLRSYWAKDNNYSNGTYPADHDQYDSKTSSLQYNSWNTVATNKEGAAQYCPENTMNVSLAGNINATTYMVIAGHYSIVKDNKETEVGEDNKLYKYIDKFYDETELLKLLAEQANIYTYTKEGKTEKWNKVDPNMYKLVRASLYDAKLELKENGDYYSAKNTDSKFKNLAEANKKLADLGTFTTFAGGKTFFYTPIEHLSSNDKQDGHIGIVRNHTYNLTLNTIKNLGNGVFDPDEEIIITEKEKNFYVGATLNILSWKVVNQDVDL